MERLSPMLAVAAREPFDAADYLFEVKWDGIRALCCRDENGWRLWGRDKADYRSRYPELAVLDALPQGTMLDGEIVLLSQGVPSLSRLLARHGRAPAPHGRPLVPLPPVSYVVFDALYDGGLCLLSRPLAERRELARQRVAALADTRVVFSEGVVGAGRAFFAQAVAAGQEGVMAKHLASPYRPGRRCAFWQKIKPWACIPAVIFGYVPGRQGVRRLLVAAVHHEQLQFVAELASGLRVAVQQQLAGLLAGRTCSRPAVPCRRRAVWVRPELYCQVRFLRWSAGGRLHGASFAGLLPTVKASGISSSALGGSPTSVPAEDTGWQQRHACRGDQPQLRGDGK
jgi:bifunctional non-homologous end joining protein LigD